MAGRRRLDSDTGEKRSEKFMIYLSPSLLRDIRDYCDLRGVSVVSYITELVNADLEDKREQLNAFRKLRLEV